VRSRAERAGRLATAAAALALGWPAVPAGPAPPQPAEIEAAVAIIRQDPNLGADRSVRVLRWVEKGHRQTAKPASYLTTLLQWLLQAFRWIAAAGRAVIVVAATILAAMLAVYLVRLFAQRQRVPRQDAGRPQPAYVRGLDIRPESLPQDIGAAALALRRSGDVRGALALLYRGLLSRAVHVHDVAVKASSTEGECLALFAPRLPRAALDYAASLVRTWELAVYRGAAPEASAVEALCSGFSAALDAPAASGGVAAP
jgi:hypothetical protein